MRHESQAARWQNSTPANPQSKKTRASSRTPSQQPAAATQAAMWAGLPVPAADAVSVPPAREGDTTFAAEQLALRRSGEVGCDMWAPLEAAAAARGDDVALHDLATSTSLSYAAVLARASRLGAWLRSAGGASAGARVGLMTPNCAPAIECHYAIAGWAGCVALNLNPRLSPDELAYCLEGADCEVLVADTSYAGLVREALQRYSKIRAVVWTDVLQKAAADLDVPTSLYETIVADGPVVERPEDAKALPGSAGAEMYGMASGAKNQGGGSEAAPFAPLLADEALGCLDYALAKSAALDAGLAEVAVVRFDFDMLARGAAAAPHLAATCAELGVGAPPRKPKKEKREAVDAAAEVLRVVAAHTTESGALSAATPLGSLALDSLEVMAIVRDVNTATGARLSVVDVLGASTLGDVAGLCRKRARKVKNDLEASSPYVYAARVERLGHRRVRSHG